MLGGLIGAGGLFKYKRWIGAWALLGALAGGWAIWMEAREPYVSTAILLTARATIPGWVTGSEPIDHDNISFAVNETLSRTSLSDLVLSLDLYHDERKRVPLEDVIDAMRKNIRPKFNVQSLQLSFTYGENFKAQKVTQALTGRLIDAVIRERTTAVEQTEEFLEATAGSAGLEMEKAQVLLREARQNGRPTERLELDAGQARRHYESLRDKRAEAHLRRRIEERHQGARFMLLDPASLPTERWASQFAPWSIMLGAAGSAVAGGVGRLLQRFALWLVAPPAARDGALGIWRVSWLSRRA